MDADTVERARAAVARLREVEAGATPGPWRWVLNEPGWATCCGGAATDPISVFDDGSACGEYNQEIDPDGFDAAAIVALRNAAPALLALAEAAIGIDGALGAEYVGDVFCVACCYGRRRYAEDHAPDCPALAIDAAIEQLAALGDAP